MEVQTLFFEGPNLLRIYRTPSEANTNLFEKKKKKKSATRRTTAGRVLGIQQKQDAKQELPSKKRCGLRSPVVQKIFQPTKVLPLS